MFEETVKRILVVLVKMAEGGSQHVQSFANALLKLIDDCPFGEEIESELDEACGKVWLQDW